MENIAKIAKLLGYASIAFAVIVVAITVLLVESDSGFATPVTAQFVYTVLQNIWVYLFIAVLLLLIAYKVPVEETEEAEEMPPEQTKLP
jgi:hypothetical protein